MAMPPIGLNFFPAMQQMGNSFQGGLPNMVGLVEQAMGFSPNDSVGFSNGAQYALGPQQQQQTMQLYQQLWMLQQKMQMQLQQGDYQGAQRTQQQMQRLYAGLSGQLGGVTAPPPQIDYPGAGNQGGGWSGPGANARPMNPGDFRGGTPMGRELASTAFHHATDGTGDGHHCYRNVKQDLAHVGIHLQGGAAYEAADQLARNPRVQEVNGLGTGDLKHLPPGAIVVWNRGNGHEYGHISIAMGDGREASDVMRNQCQHYGTSFRVFLPNDQGHQGRQA